MKKFVIKLIRFLAIVFPFLQLCLPAAAQSCAQVSRNGNQVKLKADGLRPVTSLAYTLSQQFGVTVNAEDYPDLLDWTPPAQAIEIEFTAPTSGSPGDVGKLMQRVTQEINEQLPFEYRLDSDSYFFTLVPTRMPIRNPEGKTVSVAFTPLLDHRVTIPPGKRRIEATLELVAQVLSKQTNVHIGCCRTGIAGNPFSPPWGTVVSFEAHDEPARDVLKKLLMLMKTNWGTSPNFLNAEGVLEGSSRYYWLLNCDSNVCFINIETASGRGSCR